MKSIVSALPCLLALGLLTGCETSNSTTRIQEKSSVFATLTPEQQKDIREGVIEQGYTADMVYMALGRPADKKTKDSPAGPVEMWTYHNFYPSAQISGLAAASREVYRANYVPGSGDYVPMGVRHGDSQPAISSTSGGPQTNLFLPEPVSDTLYVQFYNGKVFSIKLASQGD